MVTFFRESPRGLMVHRASQDPEAQDPLIDRQLAVLAADAELVLRLTEQMLDEPAEMPLPTSRDQAEDLAHRVRERLDLDQASPIGDLSEACARLGLWVFGLDLGLITTHDAGQIRS